MQKVTADLHFSSAVSEMIAAEPLYHSETENSLDKQKAATEWLRLCIRLERIAHSSIMAPVQMSW